jgi:hypothetical protein
MSTGSAPELDTVLDGLMDDSADEAVFDFARLARDRAGSVKQLAAIAGVPLATASMWSKAAIDRNGNPARRNLMPPDRIARILRALPDLSFDAIARGETDASSAVEAEELRARVADLEWMVAGLRSMLLELGDNGFRAGAVDIRERLADNARTNPRKTGPSRVLDEP